MARQAALPPKDENRQAVRGDSALRNSDGTPCEGDGNQTNKWPTTK